MSKNPVRKGTNLKNLRKMSESKGEFFLKKENLDNVYNETFKD